MTILLKSSLVLSFALALGMSGQKQSSANITPIDCNYYTYTLGFNHAKNVRKQCSLSQSVLNNTYTLNMSNPCFEYRVGFLEGWVAYQGYCSLNGDDNGGGGNGGGGNGGGPTPGGGGPQQ